MNQTPEMIHFKFFKNVTQTHRLTIFEFRLKKAVKLFELEIHTSDGTLYPCTYTAISQRRVQFSGIESSH